MDNNKTPDAADSRLKVLSVGLTPDQSERLIGSTDIDDLIEVRDAFEAIDLCLTTDFDLVIAQESMAQVSGSELLRSLNSANYHPQVPSVLVGQGAVMPQQTDFDEAPVASTLAIQAARALVA